MGGLRKSLTLHIREGCLEEVSLCSTYRMSKVGMGEIWQET